MYHQLVSHNDDIRRLVEIGYAVGFDNNYMVIRDIPYLDSERHLQIGAIVTKLVFVDKEKVTLEDHQIFFAGSVPYNLNGTAIPNLGGGSTTLTLTENCDDIVVQRSFSNKPAKGFQDFFEKIESYVTIISGPAIELHKEDPKANPYTFRINEKETIDLIFKFCDTLSSIAEITDLSANFKDDIIAIIGIGGTGAYVLDFLVKTPVKEIRAFDLDPFHVHNAYRSPGRLDETELGKTKAEVYQSRYENFRTGLHCEQKLIDSSCLTDLDGVTFAFVCVDKGSSRSSIFDLLLSKRIPFIDVGMGLNRKHVSLNGMIRTTYYSYQHGQEQREKKLAEEVDNKDDLYRANIQISELNAFNACLAVIKFKQLRGFYFEEDPIDHLLFEISDLKIVGNSE